MVAFGQLCDLEQGCMKFHTPCKLNGGKMCDWISDRAYLDKKYIEFMIKKMGTIKDDKVLELGCWKGASTQILKSYFPMSTIYAVDIWDGIVFNEKIENVIFVHADARALPFYSNSFQACIARMFFDVIPQEQYEDVIIELSRVIKKGGVVGIYSHLQRGLRGYPTPWINDKIKDIFSYTKKETINLEMIKYFLNKHGFVDIEIYFIIKDTDNFGYENIKEYYCITDKRKKYIKNNPMIRKGLISIEELVYQQKQLINLLEKKEGYFYALQVQIIGRKK